MARTVAVRDIVKRPGSPRSARALRRLTLMKVGSTAMNHPPESERNVAKLTVGGD